MKSFVRSLKHFYTRYVLICVNSIRDGSKTVNFEWFNMNLHKMAIFMRKQKNESSDKRQKSDWQRHSMEILNSCRSYGQFKKSNLR